MSSTPSSILSLAKRFAALHRKRDRPPRLRWTIGNVGGGGLWSALTVMAGKAEAAETALRISRATRLRLTWTPWTRRNGGRCRQA